MRIHVELDAGGDVDMFTAVQLEARDDKAMPPTAIARLSVAVFPYDIGIVNGITLTDLTRPNFPEKWRALRATYDGAEVVLELEMAA